MKRGFLFAGQGAQFVGMGKDLYENFDIAKKYFDIADNVVPKLKSVCFNGPEEKLKLTKFTQPAIYTVSAVIDEILKNEKGVVPEVAAGFSLGEYAALFSAGCFDFETGIKLVAVRGDAMNEAGQQNPGTMAAIIGLDDTAVEETCKEISDSGELVVPVNYNFDGQIVISGTVDGINKIVDILEEKGAKRAIVLNVSGAFHSPLMQPAVEKLSAALEKIEIAKPKIPIVMNATAEFVESPEEIKELMLKQFVSPVLWKQSVRNMIKAGISEFYELGPGRVLSGFMRNIDRSVSIMNFQKVSDFEKLNK